MIRQIRDFGDEDCGPQCGRVPQRLVGAVVDVGREIGPVRGDW
jgi:hypothetical protein